MLPLNIKVADSFSGEDLMKILETDGWEAILPNGLPDHQLVRLADQLRGFLWDEGELNPDEKTSAAIALALLLLAKVDPSSLPYNESLPWGGKEELLRNILMTLHVAANQEIIYRLLRRQSDAASLSVLTGINAEMNFTCASPTI